MSVSIGLFSFASLSSQSPDHGGGWLPALWELSGGRRAGGFAVSKIDFHLTPIWPLAEASAGLGAPKPVSVPTPRE